MTKLCIFGATGQTGREVLKRALDAGHEVVAPVRQPDALEEKHPRLSVVACDVTIAAEVNAVAFAGVDVVVIALGSKDLWGNTVRSQGTKNIVNALLAQKVAAHVWVVSAAGVGDSWTQMSLMNRIIAKLLLPSVMKEHEAQETAVKQSGLVHSFVRPTGLTNKESGRPYQMIKQGKLPGTSISRQQVAQCIVDHLQSDEFKNTGACITQTK